MVLTDLEPGPIDFAPGLTSKQKQLLLRLRELLVAFDWSDENGLRHVQRTIAYQLEVKTNEFLAGDASRPASEQTATWTYKELSANEQTR